MTTNSNEIRACIDAHEVIIGNNVSFGKEVRIAAIGGTADRVVIGDNVYLGDGVLVLTPEFEIGDYGTIHKRCRLSGYNPLRIGHNFWCDQNCVLNSTDVLQIGNNVGIGAYSQLWTHIRHGDTLIGCRYDMTKPMIIHDDVWFVGHCLVSPIEANPRSMAMLGSTIVRDMEENRIYGGSPARDLTEKLGAPYREVSVQQRIQELRCRLDEFFSRYPEYPSDQVRVVGGWEDELSDEVTYFNVADRTYTKRRTILETKLMHHLLPTAKFVPKQF